VSCRATGYSPDLLNLGRYHTKLKNFNVIGDSGVLTSANDLLLWEKNFWADKLKPAGLMAAMNDIPPVMRPEGLRYGCAMEYWRT
jgi:hypothetical protein